MEPNQDKKSYGALVGSIVVILIIILGGVYFWTSRQKMEPPVEQNTVTEEQSQTVESDSTAQTLNEINKLEAELNQQSSTDLSVDVSDV